MRGGGRPRPGLARPPGWVPLRRWPEATWLRDLQAAAGLLNWRKFALKVGVCPLCGPTAFVKLNDNELAVRCLRCKSGAVLHSFVGVLRQLVPNLGELHVYELSAQGPWVAYLRKHAGRVTFSEYFDDVPPGQLRDGVQCQDVQRLTFPQASFDLCTATEVFEHVADDRLAFREMLRVLKPGAHLLFTVPMHNVERTVDRARLVDGRVEHLLAPEYHGDRLRGPGSVLCFRNYGLDILGRLRAAGFGGVCIVQGVDAAGWGFARPVLVARRP